MLWKQLYQLGCSADADFFLGPQIPGTPRYQARQCLEKAVGCCLAPWFCDGERGNRKERRPQSLGLPRYVPGTVGGPLKWASGSVGRTQEEKDRLPLCL